MRDQVDGGIENEEERGNKATTPVPVPKRPFGTEVRDWSRQYTLHSDESAKKNLLINTTKTYDASHEVINMWLDSLKGDVLFTKKSGHAGTLKDTELVRLDLQQIDGKDGERQYANLQIQLNKGRGSAKETTTLAILHVELDKTFNHGSVWEAFNYGLVHRVGVWLSAKPNAG